VPLSAKDIRTAFDALSSELAKTQEQAEFVVVGGAALVLLFGARQTTKDVEAYFVKPEAALVRNAASRVAGSLDLPDDWLNDGAKAYIVQITAGPILYESESLLVRAPSTAQLLAMKLAAWRDEIDRDDARLLLSKVPGTFDEVRELIEPLVLPINATSRHTLSKICGSLFMDLRDLVRSILQGDLLTARQWVADAYRARLHWEHFERPDDMNDRELTVAAGLTELLAQRAGAIPPSWTVSVGALREPFFLDPGIEKMPRTLARAKSHGPDSLRKRNLFALPDFLDVR
jgi:hypothetical protein